MFKTKLKSSKVNTIVILCISTLVFTACPENGNNSDECGDHQVFINGECQCEDGYYWDDEYDGCLLDTTSHDFIWTIDTLGGHGSFLNDVWVVNENDIWVVGNISLPDPDSSFNGTGWKEYNMAHWNGDNWEYIGAYSNTLDLNNIFYFSNEDVWVTDCCSPIHWDGENWTLYHLENMGLDACTGGGIWGSSPSNIYFIGTLGSIVHYNGSTFRKMNTSTTINITDIYGYNEDNIWACGDDDASPKSVILRFNGENWEKIYYVNYDGSNNLTDDIVNSPKAYTIWMDQTSDYVWFNGGNGVFKISQTENPEFYIDLELSSKFNNIGFLRKIRGNGDDDIYFVGDGDAFHWNGNGWFRLNRINSPVTGFTSISIVNNYIAISGYELGSFLTSAIVVRGIHY